jgi:rhodanese-related sulfurtransferase
LKGKPVLKLISPHQANDLLAKGAQLIDVRNADEHAREHIAIARLAPIGSVTLPATPGGVVVFHCKSGQRTSTHAGQLAQKAQAQSCEAYLLDGGIEAWKAAGLPVVRNAQAPMELSRQVQIAAGALALLGFTGGVLVHPGFHALSGFIGAGLMFAGLSGWCGLAKVLGRMPWNRPTLQSSPTA